MLGIPGCNQLRIQHTDAGRDVIYRRAPEVGTDDNFLDGRAGLGLRKARAKHSATGEQRAREVGKTLARSGV